MGVERINTQTVPQDPLSFRISDFFNMVDSKPRTQSLSQLNAVGNYKYWFAHADKF